MAITVVNDFRPWCPVRNEAAITLQTNAATTPGAISFVRILFDAGDMPVQDDTLELRLDPGLQGGGAGTQLVLLTFKNSPSGATEVQTYSGGSVASWVENHLIPKLQANYWLSTHYDFSVDGSSPDYGVLIEAKEPGAEFDLMPYHTGYTPDTSLAMPGTGIVYTANFAIRVQLWAEEVLGDGDYRMVHEEEYPPDVLNRVHFDAAPILRSNLAPAMPAANMTTAVARPNMAARFYTRFCERSGQPITTGPVGQSATRIAHLAGRHEPGRLLDWQTWLKPTNLISRFLTAWPNTTRDRAKVVVPGSREFLTVITPDINNLTAIRLCVDIEYTDGTTTIAHQLEQVSSLTDGMPLLFAVGIEARNLQALEPSKTIHRYRAYLRTGLNSLMSEYRYYRVDHRLLERVRQLHYFNSMGGVDTMLITGAQELSSAVDVVRSQRYVRRPESLFELRDTVSHLNSLRRERSAGSVWLRKDERAELDELLASEMIVERVGNEHWYVELLDREAELVKEEEDLASFIVNWRHAHTDAATQGTPMITPEPEGDGGGGGDPGGGGDDT